MELSKVQKLTFMVIPFACNFVYIIIYHSISFWYWIGNQEKIGINIISKKFKII
jgi:hypothetical protein